MPVLPASGGNVDARYGTWNQVGRDQTNVQGDQNTYIGIQIINQPTSPGKSSISISFTSCADAPTPAVISPPYALRAMFSIDPGPLEAVEETLEKRRACQDGTRTDIIAQIKFWMETASDIPSPGDAPRSGGESAVTFRIFWINGSAGTGKTTIAFTIAQFCFERKINCVTFFCSRDIRDCNDYKMIIPTIAYQMAARFPAYKSELSRVLADEQDIRARDLSHQIKVLLVDPLLAVADFFKPCVVIIDALDECKDDSTTSVVLTCLSRYIDQLPLLKFLVTSRPEQNIVRGFGAKHLGPTAQQLILHEVELHVVQADIQLYLTEEIEVIRDSYCLEKSSWPVRADIELLTQMSSGLFIFASTSVKFIDDKEDRDPEGRLKMLLTDNALNNHRGSPHSRLDQLYLQVLNTAYSKISYDLARRLRLIIGSIALLKDPLSVHALETLLNTLTQWSFSATPLRIRATLSGLHSIILVPSSNDKSIRLLHPSFFDFLIAPERCTNALFQVDTKSQHASLAQACLVAMKDLMRNMCNINSTPLLNSEILDFPFRLDQRLPPHLQYACRHWASHLVDCTASNDIIELLDHFCKNGLLFWIEICSLLGILRDALISLEAAQRFLLLLPVCSHVFSKDVCLFFNFLENWRQEHNIRYYSGTGRLRASYSRILPRYQHIGRPDLRVSAFICPY